jgi:5-methyltetrahydrofolate--homocysteine methyltransferase
MIFQTPGRRDNPKNRSCSMSDILDSLSSAVIQGDFQGIAKLTEEALASAVQAQQILNEGLLPGMEHVGQEFKVGNMFVPEVLLSARAMQASMDLLKPLLAESGVPMAGKVVLGTVKGDLHDIGKNLVVMMCEGAGFEVLDLGRDVKPEAFVQAVEEFQADIVGMSALLTTTMRGMATTMDALEQAGLRSAVKVMVGGAPVTQEYADQIGADGYAANAAAAADLAKKLVSAQ